MNGDRLPNAERAIVPERKIVGYLLADTHPDGMSKARFFTGFGFTAGKWQILVAALRRHAAENPVIEKSSTPFGTQIVVEGILHAPDGRSPAVRVVWFVDHGTALPRLVTAYPADRRRHDPRT